MFPTTPKEPSSLSSEKGCRHFSRDEIHSAIQMVNEAVIGRGGFGEVFKGYIKDGTNGPTIVAIKRSKSKSDQLTPQFWAEVEMLSSVRQPNLVSFIGYCNEGSEMALVYEYMPNGSLEDQLHKEAAGAMHLSWVQLLKICLGAAQGLDYLHTISDTKQAVIIHRDVKSSNILLDANFIAKISDFGIATPGPIGDDTHVSTAVKGTPGYFDPHYYATGHLKTKSDVYAFGVVLLEVICGLPAIHKGHDGTSRGLAVWAQECIKDGKLSDIIDHRLSGQIDSKRAKEFARIACDCLHEKPHKRPEMAAIVSRLQKILSLQERLNSSTPEHKFIDKIFPCFRPNELKGGNLILAGSSGDNPSDKLNNPINDKGDPDISYIWGGEGDQVRDAIVIARNGEVHDSVKRNLMAFTFDVLQTATMNFHKDRLLGEGGFGSVYKGWINEQRLEAAQPGTGTIVAIAKKKDNKDVQSHQEWLVEVTCLGLIDHPNLVKVYGYCAEDDHKFLVYEYMKRGSLDNYLFKRRFYTTPLSWNLRMKIVLGAAKGLAYLHKPESNVVCQDFNSTSILIDSNDNARISNFGMVKDVPKDSKNQISRQVMHTKGYADPEYVRTGHFTTSSNIYSFGVVLLEVLTGQRCIDKNGPEGERILVEIAKPYLSKDVEKIIDPHRDEHYSSSIVHGAALIAERCLSEEPSCRPTADEVVEELERLIYI